MNNPVPYYINLAVGNCKKPLTVPSETYFNLSTRGCDNTSGSLTPCIKIACNKTGKIQIYIIQAFFVPNSYLLHTQYMKECHQDLLLFKTSFCKVYT